MKAKHPIICNVLLNNKLRFFALLLFVFFISSLTQFSQAFPTSGIQSFSICLATQVDIDHSQTNPKESKNIVTWEEEEKEERLESEINIDCTYHISSIGSPTAFYKISGAEKEALKIPDHKGKTPYYLLFHCLKIHLG